MFAVDVVFEGDSFLLEGLTIDVADVAVIFFVVLQVVGDVSQGGEGVEHDTRDDVAEEDAEEDAVDRVVEETDDLEGLHRLGDCSRNEELEDAVEHCLTHLAFGLLSWINVFLVVAEGDCAEDEGEDNAHEADIEEFDHVESDGAEDVADFWVVAEDVHDMEEVDGRVEEGAHEGDSHVEGHSPELHAVV